MTRAELEAALVRVLHAVALARATCSSSGAIFALDYVADALGDPPELRAATVAIAADHLGVRLSPGGIA